jgi:hypothetical protein
MIRRDGYHRVERDARVRSTRAQAHLERVRSRRAGGASAPPRGAGAPPRWGSAPFSVCCGETHCSPRPPAARPAST